MAKATANKHNVYERLTKISVPVQRHGQRLHQRFPKNVGMGVWFCACAKPNVWTNVDQRLATKTSAANVNERQ